MKKFTFNDLVRRLIIREFTPQQYTVEIVGVDQPLGDVIAVTDTHMIVKFRSGVVWNGIGQDRAYYPSEVDTYRIVKWTGRSGGSVIAHVEFVIGGVIARMDKHKVAIRLPTLAQKLLDSPPERVAPSKRT